MLWLLDSIFGFSSVYNHDSPCLNPIFDGITTDYRNAIIQGMMGSAQEPNKEFVEGIRWAGEAERVVEETKLPTKEDK